MIWSCTKVFSLFRQLDTVDRKFGEPLGTGLFWLVKQCTNLLELFAHVCDRGWDEYWYFSNTLPVESNRLVQFVGDENSVMFGRSGKHVYGFCTCMNVEQMGEKFKEVEKHLARTF